MSKGAMLGLVSAVLLLISLPAYFVYMHNMQVAGENQDTDAMSENLSGITTDFAVGEVVGKIVLLICSLVLGIVFFVLGLRRQQYLVIVSLHFRNFV